jgi:uncharacterized protein (DUF3084 family)
MAQEILLLQKTLERSFSGFTNQSAMVFNLQAQLDLKDLELKAKDKEIAEKNKRITALEEALAVLQAADILEVPK